MLFNLNILDLEYAIIKSQPKGMIIFEIFVQS